MSPEKQTRSAPAREALGRSRLVADGDERARAEVVDERKLVRVGDGGELGQPRALGEPDDAEVRLVHAKKHGGVGADRALVVGRPRAVRRSHLDESCAGASEHVGDAEAVADLDELAARDDHLAPLGERGEREQHRGGVVVDDERGFGAGESLHERGEMILTRSALASLEVVLEVRVAAADLDDPRERGGRERRATEIRVDENAGRIQHALE